MERKKLTFVGSMAVVAIGLMMAACKPDSAALRQMAGTMDEPMPTDMMPDSVHRAMAKAEKSHSHEVMNDTVNGIYVSAIDAVGETSTEGYGIEVTKEAMTLIFPDIRNTRQPQAKYNAATGDLWLTSSAMEGSGVRVEWLYQIRFGDNELAYVKAVVNPYSVQQQLLQRMRYAIDGEVITLYDGDQLLATVTNTVTDMGGMDDEQPLWIGEQLYYDVTGDTPKVVFVPGVKFTTGLVLTYDDMPELSAPITIDDGMPTIHAISVVCP